MLGSWLRSFHPAAQPLMTRQSYRYELTTAALFPVAVGMIEATVVGVLARKSFDVSPLLFAVIMAAPMFANVTSFIWARLARGRSKVRCIVGLQLGTLATLAGFALLPTTPLGAQLLTLLVIVGRCLLAGIITLRSTVWRMNYPRHLRGQLTGRLTIVSSIVMAVVPLLGYALLDRDPMAFRYVYPLSMCLAALGATSFGRIRLRGERQLLRYEVQPDAQPQPHGSPATIYEYDPQQPRATVWTVWRTDHLFRRYMWLQMLLGGSNMAASTVIVYIISDLTEARPNGYVISIALTTTIPLLLATATMPRWARHLDQVNIARFRVLHCVSFLLDQLLCWLGAVSGWLSVLTVGRLAQGVARGGAALAWHLGHNDFAARHMVALYMGIHVTLTGIRGAIAPFLGMLLYAGWSEFTIPLTPWTVPAWAGMGGHVFLVNMLATVISMLGFLHLARRMEVSRDTLADVPEPGS